MTRLSALRKLVTAPRACADDARIGRRVCVDAETGERWDRPDGRERKCYCVVVLKSVLPKANLRRIA